LPADGRFGDGGDVLEDVAFGEHHCAAVDFEGVAGGVVPVVVYLGWVVRETFCWVSGVG
jgi:hypothetical protein